MAYNPFKNLLAGTLNPFLTQAATFLTGIAPSRAGTAAFGLGQGFQGGGPGSGGAGMGTFGQANLPTLSGTTELPTTNFGGGGKGGVGQNAFSQQPTYSSWNPHGDKQHNPYSGAGTLAPPTTTPPSFGESGLTAEQQGFEKGRTAPPKPVYALPGPNGTTITYSSFTDANGNAAFTTDLNDPNAFAFTATFTDEAGNSFDAQSFIGADEIAYNAAQMGVSTEEYINDMMGYGYQMNGNNLQWAGGMGTAGGQSEEHPWWYGFESEKKANQYYTDKKRAQKKAEDRENPRKNGQFQKGGSYGITTATSNLGSG
jgi:hypothetical protein